MTRPTRESVSVAVRRPQSPSEVLLVLRPPDDAELANVWGLPASSLKPGEDWAAAIRRTGREKLGVELEVGRELRRGAIGRGDYALEMRLFEATIRAGEPSVPQPHPEVTQYRDWRWGPGSDLRPAADRGSLCCRLYLEAAALRGSGSG